MFVTGQGIEELKLVCRVCLIEKFRHEYRGPKTKRCNTCRTLAYKEAHRKYNKTRGPESPARKQQKSDWFKQRKDLWGAKLRKRRAAKFNAEGSHTEEEWLSLLNKYGNMCLACRQNDKPMTRDHVIPLSKNGSDSINNIQPLCRSCNSKKQTATTDYRVNFVL